MLEHSGPQASYWNGPYCTTSVVSSSSAHPVSRCHVPKMLHHLNNLRTRFPCAGVVFCVRVCYRDAKCHLAEHLLLRGNFFLKHRQYGRSFSKEGGGGVQILKKNSRLRFMLHVEDPQILVATGQNLVVSATGHPGFLYPWCGQCSGMWESLVV